MTVFASEHNARTFDFSAGDVGAVPFAYGHYIENTSADVKLRFLEVFKSAQFQDVSLNQWIALTPPELVKQHLNLSNKVMNFLHKQKMAGCKINQKEPFDRNLASDYLYSCNLSTLSITIANSTQMKLIYTNTV